MEEMADDGAGAWGVMIIFAILILMAFIFLMLVTRYKRCASDEILVVFGRVKGARASRCILVVPRL